MFGDNNLNERLALFDDSNNPIAEHETSSFINTFFAQVGSNLANHINESYGVELEKDRLKPVGYNGDYKSFVWQPFTYDDVLKQVKTIQMTIVIYKDIDTVLNPHCIEAVQSDFDRIITWCRLNELTMNVKKTKAQFFPRNRNLDLLLFKENYALNIDNINI